MSWILIELELFLPKMLLCAVILMKDRIMTYSIFFFLMHNGPNRNTIQHLVGHAQEY